MGCATTTVKVASIVFNVLLGILGVGAIGWIAFNPESLRQEMAIGSYIACSLIVLFSFLGCFSAIRESICLSSLCAIFLLILAILQITALCMDLGSSDGRSGVKTIENAWDHNAMDGFQRLYECCGKSGVQDYILLDKDIPVTCYLNQDKNDPDNIFKVGCIAKLQEFYDNEKVLFNIVSWILIAFEITGFLLMTFLVISFRNTQRRMQF